MIYILNTKEYLFHHHSYTINDKFTLLNTKTSINVYMLRLHVFIYVYHYLCLFMFFFIDVFIVMYFSH